MGKVIFDKSDYRYGAANIASSGDTLLATALRCSQNIDKGISWGYSELVAKISTDGGESWSDEIKVALPPARKITAEEGNTKSSFFLYPVTLTAKNGEFVIIFTYYPESMGAEEEKLLDKKKTPFTHFGGKNCPIIYDREGNFFIITDSGKIIDSSKAATDYTLKEFGELYNGDEYVGNIYLNGAMGKSEGLGKTTFGAPLKAPKRSYIMMVKSSDGINWSEPRDITPSILGATDGACITTSAGNGAVCDNGRIIIPLNCEKGASCIYSDDNGETWNRNQRIPVMPVKGDVSVMQAPNGEIIAVGKKACISHDNGITWLKDKNKFAPVKAISDGGKVTVVVNSKAGTALVSGEFEYKKNKYKGVDYSDESLALAGGLLPCTDIKSVNGKTALLYVTPDRQQVSFDTMDM